MSSVCGACILIVLITFLCKFTRKKKAQKTANHSLNAQVFEETKESAVSLAFNANEYSTDGSLYTTIDDEAVSLDPPNMIKELATNKLTNKPCDKANTQQPVYEAPLVASTLEDSLYLRPVFFNVSANAIYSDHVYANFSTLKRSQRH
ncbi:uncharacterized protein LOC131939424 [Physella acuta]|uniref:uncharacterized protein LOC131939424 n=1 Tax=Physella acuta TaxID=109671 RepID=UPI0027DDD947|nr:uncharacterized protein LOC131939424 [Physella acuta]